MAKAKAKEQKLTKKEYLHQLRILQIELVKFQRHLIKNNLRLLIIFEGRDAAGKDGVIKRIVQHLSPRETRVVALGKPSSHDLNSWYFQRYAPFLPSAQDMVLMNRSWYNRAGVERVMNFCTAEEYESFMESVVPFEALLVKSGIQIIKYYLDITKSVQKKRLDERKLDPLSQWKMSDIDEVAVTHWQDYSQARNDMLKRTSSPHAPWYVVNANNKKKARLNVIRHFLSCVECPDKDVHHAMYDRDIVFLFNPRQLKSGMIAP